MDDLLASSNVYTGNLTINSSTTLTGELLDICIDNKSSFEEITTDPVTGEQTLNVYFSKGTLEDTVISLDSNMRMEGLPALYIWEQVIAVLEPFTEIPKGQALPQRSKKKQAEAPNLPTIVKPVHMVNEAAEKFIKDLY